MRITFVYAAYESLGIEYMSSLLKSEGHKVSLIYLPRLFDDSLFQDDELARRTNKYRHIAENVAATRPDIAAFSVFTDSYRWCLNVAKGIKRIDPSIINVFGGIHPTAEPEETLSHDQVDYVIQGEGEGAILDLMKVVEGTKSPEDTPNLCYRKPDKSVVINPPRPLIEDLDTIPWPDHELFWKHAPYFREAYPIMTSRGCFFKCSFCNNNLYHALYPGMSVRRRSVKDVIGELQYASKAGAKSIIFEDDMFISDRRWSIEFLRKYEKHIGLPYQCLGHPGYIDSEIASLLKSSGCVNIEIGVQSLKPATRTMLNRVESIRCIDKTFKTLRDAGVRFNIDHIGGAPGETEVDQKKAALRYNLYRPNRITFFFLTYYPGTDLAHQAMKDPKRRELALRCIKGLSSSFEQTGSVSDPEIHERYRTLMGLMPLLPAPLVNMIIRKNLVRYLPRDTMIAKVLPSAISIIMGHEVRGFNIMKKYIYHLIRLPLGCKWL